MVARGTAPPAVLTTFCNPRITGTAVVAKFGNPLVVPSASIPIGLPPGLVAVTLSAVGNGSFQFGGRLA